MAQPLRISGGVAFPGVLTESKARVKQSSDKAGDAALMVDSHVYLKTRKVIYKVSALLEYRGFL